MSDIFIILKAAISVDGYLGAKERLIVSGPGDRQEVNKLRESVDAILVGAGTVRADNPSLLHKSSSANPIRVVLSKSAKLSPDLNLLNDNLARTIVYHCSAELVSPNTEVEFCFLGKDTLDLKQVLAHLATLGVRRLLVEGGAEVLKQFYSQGLFNQIRLSVGPQYLGKAGVRLVLGSKHKLRLTNVEVLGQNTVHSYHKR